jgi:hypothetical protein
VTSKATYWTWKRLNRLGLRRTFRGVCGHCGVRFARKLDEPARTDPVLYCSQHCALRARKKRNEARRKARAAEERAAAKAAEEAVRCPRPDKQIYTTQRDAWLGVFRYHPNDHDIVAYRCRCTFWHVGHPTDQGNQQQLNQEAS